MDPVDGAHWESVEEAAELIHEERFRDALAELKRVLAADARNPYAYYFIGITLFEVGELEPARDAFRAALKLKPGYLGARVGLANTLRQLGDLKDAIREGLAALSQAPGDADALYAIGMAYLTRGDEVAARRYLEAFLEAKPEFEAALEVRGVLDAMGGGRPTDDELN
jgi:tetratricopeptide (TPR) repeat protein